GFAPAMTLYHRDAEVTENPLQLGDLCVSLVSSSPPLIEAITNCALGERADHQPAVVIGRHAYQRPQSVAFTHESVVGGIVCDEQQRTGHAGRVVNEDIPSSAGPEKRVQSVPPARKRSGLR